MPTTAFATSGSCSYRNDPNSPEYSEASTPRRFRRLDDVRRSELAAAISPVSSNCLKRCRSSAICCCGSLAQQPGERGTNLTGRWIVLKLHTHLGRAIAGRFETNRSRADDVGLAHRFPRQQRRRNIVDDLRIPTHGDAKRSPRHPVRVGTVVYVDRLEMRHEARQVLEVAPVGIDLADGTVNGNRVLHDDAARPAEMPFGRFIDVARVAAHGGGNRTPSARAAREQPQTQESERPVRTLDNRTPPKLPRQASTPTVQSRRYWVCTLMSSMAPFQTPRHKIRGSGISCRRRAGTKWLSRKSRELARVLESKSRVRESESRSRECLGRTPNRPSAERGAESNFLKSSGRGASNDMSFRSTG